MAPVSIDDLMTMMGLTSVKRSFKTEFESIKLAKEQGISLEKRNFNARFDGNPGTGKTTVATLYAQLLIDLGVLPPQAKICETSGPKLASGGIKALEDLLNEGTKSGGAVIFIDEAYALNPKDNQNGRMVCMDLIGAVLLTPETWKLSHRPI